MAVKGQTGSTTPARSQCETPEIMRSARRALPHPRVSRPRPNVIGHVSVTTFERIRIQPAGKTGDTRPAFQSARKSFVPRKSCNTFGDRHRACVNCPTNLRSGSHSAPPPPSSSRRIRSARRSPPGSHPGNRLDQRKRGGGHTRTPGGRHGRHGGALETNDSGTMASNAPKWPKSIFFTVTRVETTRRSRNSKALGHLLQKTRRGNRQIPGYKTPRGSRRRRRF